MATETPAADDPTGAAVGDGGTDETKTSTAGAEVTQTETYVAGSKSRNRVGATICYVMAVNTLLLVVAQCWGVYKSGHTVDWLTAGVVLFPSMSIAMSYMGLLNKERRDVLSAVVGDANTRPGVVEGFFEFLRMRRGAR